MSVSGVVGPPRGARIEPSSGVRFDKYRLIRELAVGGMARIYLASIDGPGGFSKMCVVKRILSSHAQDESFSNMFVTEARVAALLNHPNIVSVFDFGQVGNEHYIAMEWVDGASLEIVMRHAFEKGIIPGPAFAVSVAVPLCEALAYAHTAAMPGGTSLNLVHRDLTPGNVLLASNGTVKLTDFGVVKVDVGSEKTSVGIVKGKFAYMSPEQVRGDRVDARTDVYAIGILLHELVTGQWLFRRAHLTEMVAAVSLGKIPQPSSLGPGVPEGIERIIMKALAFKLEDRYQTVREMLTELEAYRREQQWNTGPREIAELMQRVLPPVDPKRFESTMSEPTNARRVSDVIDSDDDEDSNRSTVQWIIVAAITLVSGGLWFWLLM